MDVFLNNSPVKAFCDPGSVITMISEDFAMEHQIRIHPYEGTNVYCGNQIPFDIIGSAPVRITYITEAMTGQTLSIDAVVVRKIMFNLLLGNDFNKRAWI